MDTQPSEPQNAQTEAEKGFLKRPLRFFRALMPIAPNRAIYADDFVRIVIPKGWGMQELRVDVKADITAVGFNERERHQKRMQNYFG